VIRFQILARNIIKHKKFGILFKDARTYQSEQYARRVMKRNEEYYPELEFKVEGVVVNNCPHCKQVIKGSL
jgi:hypothetical protein